MSTKRFRWFLLIIIIELLAVISIMIWAVVKNDQPKTDTTADNQNTSEQTGALTASFVATGLTVPTDIVSAPVKNDNRLFATERQGVIRVVSESKLEATPFLDIKTLVKDQGEMGLLGMAFHPKFAENHFVYVYYIDKEQHSVVARYTTANDTADPATAKIILNIPQPAYDNHKGGALRFGPDGFLYIGLGDGGSGGDPENRAQDKTTLLGKLLRIDVDGGDPYAVPGDNPFANDPQAKPEIWALGLRNPWRISFDTKTGDLFIGDVGQNKYEEVNLQLAASKGGENYGWRCYEGLHEYNTAGCQAADTYIKPILEYDHSGTQCSVTGGYVYRGAKQPGLAGKYIYADYCSGGLFVAEQQNGGWKIVTTLDTPYHISSFGQDSQGELYLADADSGSIYRVDTN